MAYPEERKEATLGKLLPPVNKSVAEVAKEEGIPSATIYNWRVRANQSGIPLPRKTRKTEDWTAVAFSNYSLESHALIFRGYFIGC